jgi:C4-dicarboxylate-specific signal transduction histidine kinase
MRFSPLQRKIALRLALVILAGSVMIDLVMIISAQELLLREREQLGKMWLRSSCPEEGGAVTAEGSGAMATACLDGNFRPLAHQNPPTWLGLNPALKEKLRQGEDVVYFQGAIPGVLWRQAERMVIVSPLQGTGVRAAAGVWPLAPLYQQIRRLHRLLLGYLLINGLVLEWLGFHLISRVAFRPLHRLVRRAQKCSEEGDWFGADLVDKDEYGQLSHALNRIYGGIQAHRDELAGSVERLEAANRDLRQARQEVQQAEKLAAIGRLAAGLAHEIGNPLGIVTGYLDLLGDETMRPAQRRDILKRIDAEVSRIGRIMRQLLHLARPLPQKRKLFSVNELLRDTIEIFQVQLFGRSMEIRMRLEASPDRVCADPESLRQVFLNLIINAADAVIAADRADGRILIRSETIDGTLAVFFQDNGIGIDPVDLPMIFDPFFTTKQPGQGTGLGLAVSYMIVDALGGQMTAESRGGEGTVLTVRLTVAEAAVGPSRQPEERHRGKASVDRRR